jgi:outer membrane receptor protein involved in Fe transport
MSGLVRLAFAFCFCLTFVEFVPSVVWSQDSAPAQLEEVVVSATRLQDVPVDPKRVPANITVITQKEIKESGARTIQEILQYQPSITVYDEIGNDYQQKVAIRGFVGDVIPTTIVVDGVRTNTPDFNTANFDLIPLDDIERIEIMPGPSPIYGKNAIGGVINIVTKRGARERQATVESAFGSFHRERYRGNASGSWGKYDYYLGVGRETENGYRDDTAARVTRLFSRFGMKPDDLTDLSATFTHISDRLKQGGALNQTQLTANRRQNPTPGDFQDSELNKITVDGRRRLGSTLSVALNGFYAHQDSHSFVVGLTSRSRTITDFFSGGGTLQVTHDSKLWGHRNVLITGGEFTRHDFEDVTRRRVSGENVYAAFVQDTLDLTSQIALTGSVRYDWDRLDFTDNSNQAISGFKTYTRVTPAAGITYQPMESLSLYFNYSEGFRTPTQFELFTAGGSANKGLKPVKSKNYEVGGRVKAGQAQLGFALYQSDVEDEIFFTCNVPNCVTFTGTNRNIDKTRRRGIEASSKARLDPRLDGFVNYTYTEATFQTSFSDLNGNTGSGQTVEKGDTIPLVPKNLLATGINYRPFEGGTLSLTGLYVSTKFLVFDEANSGKRLPGYFLLNSRASYERRVSKGAVMALFLQANNLLETRYETRGIFAFNSLTFVTEPFFVPAPGISFFGGISYRFESF